jgi:hypothetical protein
LASFFLLEQDFPNLFPDSGLSSSTGLKRPQEEPWGKHNRVIDELFERKTVGLPSLGMSGKKVGDLQCFQRIAR